MINTGQQIPLPTSPVSGSGFPVSPGYPTPAVLQALTKPASAPVPEEGKSARDSSGSQEKTVIAKPKSPAPARVLIDQLAWAHSLYKIGNQYVLSVVYGMIAMDELNIPLNSEETAQALASPASLLALAATIREHPRSYDARHITL